MSLLQDETTEDTAEDAQDEFASQDTYDLGEFGDSSDTELLADNVVPRGSGRTAIDTENAPTDDSGNLTIAADEDESRTDDGASLDAATNELFEGGLDPTTWPSEIEDAWNDATPDLGDNPLEWGPDWLDEAALALIALAVLFVLRPYMEGANTAADAVT